MGWEIPLFAGIILIIIRYYTSAWKLDPLNLFVKRFMFLLPWPDWRINQNSHIVRITPRMRTWKTSWAAGSKARSSFTSTKSRESVDAVRGTYPPEELDRGRISHIYCSVLEPSRNWLEITFSTQFWSWTFMNCATFHQFQPDIESTWIYSSSLVVFQYEWKCKMSPYKTMLPFFKRAHQIMAAPEGFPPHEGTTNIN